jgi:hypothetical protein
MAGVEGYEMISAVLRCFCRIESTVRSIERQKAEDRARRK